MISNIYIRKLMEFNKLYKSLQLGTGSISALTYNIATARGTYPNVLTWYSSSVSVYSNTFLLNVLAGTTPNILRLYSDSMLSFGGTKVSKTYLDDYFDLPQNFDLTNNEYVIGSKNISGTVYDFVMYPIYQSLYDSFSLFTGISISVSSNNDATIYSTFASANSQWLNDPMSVIKTIVNINGVPNHYIVRPKEQINSDRRNLTYKATTKDDETAFDLNDFKGDLTLDFTTNGIITSKLTLEMDEV